MKQKFGIFIALLVFICSNNVKVVLSQLSFGNMGGFSNSYSSPPLGSSLNFQSVKDWHHFGNGATSLRHSDAFNNWPNTNLHIPSSGWNRNSGVFPSFGGQNTVFVPSNPNFDIINRVHTSYESQLTTTTKSTASKTTQRTKPTITMPAPQYEYDHHYGNTFGRNWLLKNTYIAKKNYYESQPPLCPGPLTKALFTRSSLWGYPDGLDTNDRIKWDKSDDKKWRATTRAPYFENLVPGENKILPASAVDGAATAFGLVSLLPIIVPTSKPLMYCGNTKLKQLSIQIFDEIYICKNDKIEISCEENFRNQSNFNCPVQEMKCDLKDEEIEGNIYCKDRTLFSKVNIFCDRKITLNETDETITVLNCHEGILPKHLASFIPTTTFKPTTTQAPKPLSVGAKAHIFLLKLMGKFEVLEEKTTTTTKTYPYPQFDAWHPEALTILPVTTTRLPKIKKTTKSSNSKSSSDTTVKSTKLPSTTIEASPESTESP